MIATQEKKNTDTQVPTYSNLHFGKGEVSYSIPFPN
jgi:hypothetical protein